MRHFFSKLALVATVLSLMVLVGSPVRAADVNNFTIQDYTIDYYLAKDSQGRSTLKTVEVISALFPATDQNHGIERAIPTTFDNHPTSLQINAVTDAADHPLNYTTYDSNDNQVVRIGNADVYVHGLQTYKITYTQRDVTKYYSDTNDDEFYWDTNGTQWAVPINNLSVRLHVDSALSGSLTNKQSCYFGSQGSTDQCLIMPAAGGFMTRLSDLQPYQNATIAVGFTPHTFAPYQMSLAETLFWWWLVLMFITLLIAMALTLWFALRASRRSQRIRDLKVIVPEYLPPKNYSVSTSASISRRYQRVFSAQLIDLAVRHYLKIYQTREKSVFKNANYELEIIKDISNLKDEEREVLTDIFANTSVGARLDMETLKRNVSVTIKLSDNTSKVNKAIAGKYALRARDPQESAWFKRAAFVTCIAGVITLSPWLLLAALCAWLISVFIKPLTDEGLALARYLKGLELYIKTAETERLRMLQSPDGAAKIGAPIDTNDKRQLIKLYERVLPYAILFGQEKDWNKQLGQYYEQASQSPSWYVGHNAVFNAVVFSAAMNSFYQVASYTDPTSASSGGAGGGGFSGGGGGGGGGGGW